MVISSGQLHRIARCDRTFFQDREVKTSPAALEHGFDGASIAKSNSQFVTRQPRLGDHELGGSNCHAITNVCRMFEQSFGGEIFSECRPAYFGGWKLLPPKCVMLGWIDVNGLINSAVNR